MNKILFLIFCFIFMTTSISYADYSTKTNVTRENLLEDAVIDLLQPQMYEAVQKHYGTTYQIAFQCLRVKEIKKLDHSGSWLFEATLEGTTYTGAHTPLDIFTITVKKDWEDLKWVLKDYKVRKYNSKEKYECRSPT